MGSSRRLNLRRMPCIPWDAHAGAESFFATLQTKLPDTIRNRRDRRVLP